MPDNDYATCPLLRLAVALASQVTPGSVVFANLPEDHMQALAVTPTTPLIDVLDNPAENLEPDAGGGGVGSGRGSHRYLNRMLDCNAVAAGVEEHLSSHSIHRWGGGAQHANPSSALTAHRIFDRGAWNMSTTSEAFAYVFNTPSEDARVARVSAGVALTK